MEIKIKNKKGLTLCADIEEPNKGSKTKGCSGNNNSMSALSDNAGRRQENKRF